MEGGSPTPFQMPLKLIFGRRLVALVVHPTDQKPAAIGDHILGWEGLPAPWTPDLGHHVLHVITNLGVVIYVPIQSFVNAVVQKVESGQGRDVAHDRPAR